MKIDFQRSLFIGPHPDDVELGCGGIISRNAKNSQMIYLILSPCLEDPKNKNILNEAKNAINILGLRRTNLIVENLPRRDFNDHRREIREILISARQKFDPDVVYCPSIHDIHQDHSVTADETLRLFRDIKVVLSYEAPRSSWNFEPTLYMELSDKDLRTKIDALMAYKSQYDKYYFDPGVIESYARMRGSQCRIKYAEAFEVLRMRI